MATPWPLLLLHLLLLAASRLSSLASAAAVADVLLQFKAALSASASGTDVALRNWVPGSSPCRANVTLWSGVICNLDGSVRGVKIENMSLAGTLNTDALVGIPTLRTMSFKNNSFEGAIPDLTKFPGLRSVYLSMNRFSGEVPDGLFDRLQWIKKVHFSRNQFSGPIPSSLARAARLLELRLDGNQFHGRIPNFRQPGLWLANLSNNNLQGPIPRRFRKMNADWFAGNDDLCGAPLRYECGSPRRSPGFIAGIILVCIAVLLAAIGSSFIFCRSRKQHKDAGGALPTTQPAKIEPVPANREEHASGGSGKKVPKEEQGRLAFVKEDRVKFNIQDLLKASAEVLGSGSFGSSYKAILSEGPAVVVKRFKEMNGVGREDFYEHMRRIGRLTHPNLLPLVAYYYRKEEKLLVTDYVFHGSLAHPKILVSGSKGSTSVPPLDWPSRLKIVKGVGRGLGYLHEELPVLAVPHGHLKSSNVLLTYTFEPILSDYALVPVMNKSHASQIMVAFKAPECAGGGRPSKKSDVWSFGILILEILTGRFPANYLRKGRHVGTDLASWVSSLVKAEEERQQQQQRSAGEVFDANMKGTEGGEGEMLKLLRVALACSEADVERRCELEEALARIEALKERDDNDGNCN